MPSRSLIRPVNFFLDHLNNAIKYGTTNDQVIQEFIKGGKQPNGYGTALNYVVGHAILFSKGDAIIKCALE